MPTLKSKLKEALIEERNRASMCMRQNPNSEVAREWFDSINRIIDVCDQRKRY